MKFILKLPPQTATAQEKGVSIEYVNGKAVPRFYTKPRVKNAKNNYIVWLYKFAPKEPIRGAVGLKIVFHFKSKVKRGWKVTRPDLDNMEKLLLDAMTETGFWKDDSQVVIKSTAKRWDIEDSVEIEVTELGFSPL